MTVSLAKLTFLEGLCLFFFFLAVPRGLLDLSSQTRDRTRALGSESAESSPLNRQGIPAVSYSSLSPQCLALRSSSVNIRCINLVDSPHPTPLTNQMHLSNRQLLLD